jgi:hypothetical protein
VQDVLPRYPQLDGLRRLFDRMEPLAAARGFPS